MLRRFITTPADAMTFELANRGDAILAWNAVDKCGFCRMARTRGEAMLLADLGIIGLTGSAVSMGGK